MMKFLSLMTAASAAETESKEKFKGKVPPYPAAGPLDEGSSAAWLIWNADFLTYASINNLTELLTPPNYGKVVVPQEVSDGPLPPCKPARAVPAEPKQPDAKADAEAQSAWITAYADYEQTKDEHTQYEQDMEVYQKYVTRMKDNMLKI